MQFDLPKETSSIIKVIGVGGGGSNAINHMYTEGIRGVNFVICNTDQQDLDKSPIPNKVQLGGSLTEGLGAGSNPQVGKLAAEDSLAQIKDILENNTKMLFITAGMGGGTGTGGAPVIAELAKSMGILTVAIVTTPFKREGIRRLRQAEEGVEVLRKHVDAIIVISNDKLRNKYGNLTLSEAFSQADDVLTTAAKGIAEIITITGYINVDFEDVKTVMMNSGVALMGTATAEGEHRALRAVESALSSPLLSDSDISGAKHILLNITSGKEEVTMDEIDMIMDHLQEAAGQETDIIWGNCQKEELGDKLEVTIIATGFQEDQLKTKATLEEQSQRKIIIPLGGEPSKPEPPQNEAIARLLAEPEMKNTPQAEQSTDEVQKFDLGSPEPQNSEEPEMESSWLQDDQNSTDEEEEYNPEPVLRGPETVADYTNQQSFQEKQDEIQKEDIQKEENTTDESQFTFTFNLNEDEAETPEESEPTADLFNPDSHQLNIERTVKPEPEKDWLSKAEDKTAPQPAETPKPISQRNTFSELKKLSMKFSKSNVEDLEKEPAYKRKDINFEDVPHSSENPVSRFTLSENEDAENDKERFELRKNNTFLHDNVD